MNRLHQIPLVLPALAFGGGIFLKSMQSSWEVPAIVISGVLVVGWWLRLIRVRGVFRDSLSAFGVLIGGMFCLGYLWMSSLQTNEADWIVDENQAIEVAAILEKPLKFSPKGRTGQIRTYAMRYEGDAWRPRKELLKWFTRDTSSNINLGDTLYIQGSAKLITSNSASYQAYLDKEGMHYILFTKTWKVGGEASHWRFQLSRLQKKLSKHWDEFCTNPEYAALAKAMFLGDKQSLSKAVRERFATAGFSHMLAISGLHVGILFVLLSSLTRPLNGFKLGRWLGTILLLGALGGFSLLTGASASVVRASNMLGVYLVVRLVHQRIHPLNVWALCGLLQMIWAPDDLLTVGFQLSYLAVGALLLFLPVYARWVKTPWSWLNRIYELIGVNLLATAVTAPLVWYYFGSFPSYFLPANLMVAPILFVLVFSGFLGVILSLFSTSFAAYPAWICEKGLMMLDVVASETSKLPYAKLEAWEGQEKGWGILCFEIVFTLLLILLPKIIQFLHIRYTELKQKNVV